MARPSLFSDLYGLWLKVEINPTDPQLLAAYNAAYDAAVAFAEKRMGGRLSKSEIESAFDRDYGTWLKEEREIK